MSRFLKRNPGGLQGQFGMVESQEHTLWNWLEMWIPWSRSLETTEPNSDHWNGWILETHLLAFVEEVNFSFSSLIPTDPRIMCNMPALESRDMQNGTHPEKHGLWYERPSIQTSLESFPGTCGANILISFLSQELVLKWLRWGKVLRLDPWGDANL